MKTIAFFYLLISLIFSCSPKPQQQTNKAPAQAEVVQKQNEVLTKNRAKASITPHNIVVGAAQKAAYIGQLKQKSVALVVNQTSMVNGKHLVDDFISNGIKVKKVFAPEHGFRGKADAGEQVSNSKDVKTGLPIISLYGKNKKPTAEQLAGLEVVVFDIQDVGARFYTYISTMHYVMEACAEQGISVLILDRPNPNGHYVDGPVLEADYKSFVGMHPIPIVHGMTVGELAQMINGEGWLKGGIKCDISIIPCENYTHSSVYELPIKPSPNLPNLRAIYLYPSLCLFEPTIVSVGRGTDKQFQIIGSPSHQYADSFTPVPKPGAKYPKHENKTCYGKDFTAAAANVYHKNALDLSWLIQYYKATTDKAGFFTNAAFFNKLAGNSSLQSQLKSGANEASIRASWEPKLSNFKEKRKKYLLYEDF